MTAAAFVEKLGELIEGRATAPGGAWYGFNMEISELLADNAAALREVVEAADALQPFLIRGCGWDGKSNYREYLKAADTATTRLRTSLEKLEGK